MTDTNTDTDTDTNTNTNNKFYGITADELHKRSLKLAKIIYDSGFRPKKLIALWRGGTPIALYIHEYFKFKGHDIDHIAIRTSSYNGMEQQKEIRVHGLGYIVETTNADDDTLIIDDIFDSGKTIDKVLTLMRQRMRLNMPRNIKVATLCFKPDKVVVGFNPDYHLIKTDVWVDFPHELEGLTDEEIRQLKGDEIYNLLKA